MLATDPLRVPSVQVPRASAFAAGPAARDGAGEARVGRVAPPPTSAQLALRAAQFPPFLSPCFPHSSPSFPSSPSSPAFSAPSFLLVLSSASLWRAWQWVSGLSSPAACLRLEKPGTTWPGAHSQLQRHSTGRHPSLPDLTEFLCRLLPRLPTANPPLGTPL